MTLTLLALGFLVLIAVGYRFYGRWVARQFKLDDGRITPRAALTMASILFLQTFLSLRPTFLSNSRRRTDRGPILACQSFGWLPCLLWIGLGVVLIGAVHDFAALGVSASRRHLNCRDRPRTPGKRRGPGDDGFHLDRAYLCNRCLH